MKKYRKGSFEDRMNTLLPETGPFNVIFHELWRDAEGGWSTNDSWHGARNCDRDEAIAHLRNRWEVFKANYMPKAAVKDIQDASYEDGETLLEVDCTPLANVNVIKP